MTPGMTALPLRPEDRMNLQSLTVQYDPAQDRLFLIARDEEVERVLLMTRRLSFSLMGALGRLIQQSQGSQQVEAAGQLAELLSMKHVHALSQVRTAQAEHPPSRPAPRRLSSRLITQIDIRAEAPGRVLVFSDSKGPIAQFPLDARQLHWFVGRLVSHSRAAGWGDPVPVPAWLDQAGSPEFAAIQAGAYPLH